SSSVVSFLRPSRLTASGYFSVGCDLMRVLIAPDSFGDSLSAVEAAEAIVAGWGRARPDDELIPAAQSDGGPGFVDVLASRLGQLRSVRVCGPLEAAVDANWVLDNHTATAYLESAQACGLAILGGPPTPHTAVTASTTGVGQLIVEALDAGAAQIVVGLGGSATTDGGRGMVEALGAHTRSTTGSALRRAQARLAGVDVIAATDVEHP